MSIATAATRYEDGCPEPALTAIGELALGRPVVVVDGDDRDSEGALVAAGERADAELVNFMAVHARGLISAALTPQRCDALGLRVAATRGRPREQPDFLVPVEARHGISTGISAADRARTFAVLVDAEATPQDLTSPGHVIPLRVRPGGVLERAGKSEAAVDLVRLAGHEPVAVVCGILGEDGGMARRDELLEFAERHGMATVTVAEVARHRRGVERLVERVDSAWLASALGGCRAIRYRERFEPARHHLALVKGAPDGAGAVPVHLHVADVLEDVFGGAAGQDGGLRAALRALAAQPCGVVLYLLPPDGLATLDRVDGSGDGAVAEQQRAIAAWMLRDLGVARVRSALADADPPWSLVACGIEVEARD